LGIEQVIRPGEVNWMTSGWGISHSERFDGMRNRGGRLHGLQAWVAFPVVHEEVEPSFEHYGRGELQDIDAPGMRARLIAGSAFGATSNVRTHSPLFYAHLELEAGTRAEMPSGYSERAAYVVSGSVETAGRVVGARTMVVFSAASVPVLSALEPSTVMVLGGEPVGARHVWWNFVSSRKERIEQAKRDWADGRFALPPGDGAEWIPLPEGA
ncbi:MAG TPA: pirin-like C-terminal cupin domain-containing protein, partial [Burkholderiaceae bacterium]|nr:pirin-like C-terminal cupin domain-containing protein [Burkholderiaceae bacterium]